VKIPSSAVALSRTVDIESLPLTPLRLRLLSSSGLALLADLRPPQWDSSVSG